MVAIPDFWFMQKKKANYNWLFKEGQIPRESLWPAANHWQTLSHNVVFTTPSHVRNSYPQLKRFSINGLIKIEPSYDHVRPQNFLYAHKLNKLCNKMTLGCTRPMFEWMKGKDYRSVQKIMPFNRSSTTIPNKLFSGPIFFLCARNAVGKKQVFFFMHINIVHI